MHLGDLAQLLGSELPPGLDPESPVGSIECRPAHVAGADVFFVFEEFFEHQRWFDRASVARVLRGGGPRLVVSDCPLEGLPMPRMLVENAARSCGLASRAFYRAPDTEMPVVGVTGTNGKTTTTQLIAHILQKLTGAAGAVGTLGTWLNGRPWEEGDYTTGLAVETYRKLRRLADAGARGAAIEVSSHGMALDRLAGMQWAVGVLTQVTRDHLEFHGSLRAYRAAKQRLFSALGDEAVAVLNADDPFAGDCMGATGGRVLTYGRGPTADWRLCSAEFDLEETRFVVENGDVRIEARTPLMGEFQLQNVLAATVAVIALGHEPTRVFGAISGFAAVRGRMERIPVPGGISVIIDYAHNPGGLETLLQSCRALQPKRLAVVFGCGGDRDRGKRPLMGSIAARQADRVWLTSDNPRTEDPERILAEILCGAGKGAKVRVECDRRSAILAALNEAGPGELVVIAGKGHESYQIVGDEKRPFSDHAVVEEWIAQSVALD